MGLPYSFPDLSRDGRRVRHRRLPIDHDGTDAAVSGLR